MENLSELESNILKAVEEGIDVMKDGGFTNEEIETQLDTILDQIGERSDFFKEEIQTLKEEKLDIPFGDFEFDTKEANLDDLIKGAVEKTEDQPIKNNPVKEKRVKYFYSSFSHSLSQTLSLGERLYSINIFKCFSKGNPLIFTNPQPKSGRATVIIINPLVLKSIKPKILFINSADTKAITLYVTCLGVNPKNTLLSILVISPLIFF